MKETATKVFLACAFGALIGGAVVLQIGRIWYSGLMGFLVGGLVGYFSYEFKAVIHAVKEATIITIRESSKIRPNWYRVDYGAKIILWLSISLTGNAIVFFSASAVVFIATGTLSIRLGVLTVLAISGLLAAAVSVAAFIVALDSRDSIPEQKKRESEFLSELRSINPIRVWLYLIPKGIFWCFIRIPKVFLFGYKIVKLTFITIHSELRLLCLLDAGIGAVVCYQIWSPYLAALLLGALAGGVLGVANYYLISVKLLKLVPVKVN